MNYDHIPATNLHLSPSDSSSASRNLHWWSLLATKWPSDPANPPSRL